MEKKFTNVLVVLIVFLLSQMGGIAPLAVGQSLSCSADITEVNDAGKCSAVVTYPDPVASSFCTRTSLGLGDIAFTGYIDDGRNRYSFVLLVDIPKGTSIHFTDRGWKADGGFRNISETIATWTATSSLSAGTEVLIDDLSASTGMMSGSSLRLNDGGDQIFAYIGTQPTASDQSNFLAAIQMNGEWDAGASENRSAKPSVFTDGVNSISIYPEKDNAAYKCTTTTGTPAKLRSEINDQSNWEATNNIDDLRNPPSCGFTVLCTASISLIEGLPSGSAFPVGTTTVKHRATYGDGSTADCSFDVTVNDTEDPTPSCPADITVNNDPGLCSAVVSFAATATDNCDTDVDITYSKNPGTAFPVGTTTVTATATDDDSNADDCSFDVTVNDNEAPTPSCPADITVNNDPGLCSAVVSFAATATDNCDTDVDITYSKNPGTVFPVGTTTVTATATDDDGNADDCSFEVTVNDNEAPTPSCPADITVNNDPGLCSAVVSFAATATDNCDTDVDITYSKNPGTAFPVGTTTVTATATDDDGNADNCSFDVTVNDNEAPTPSCPADITVNNDPGLCSAVISFTATATDNCDTDVDITYSKNPGTAFPVGTTTVTATATDDDGNADDCSFDVTVNDNEAPTPSCPADITVNNDPGLCSAVVSFAATATDNCDTDVDITYSQNPGTVFPVGTTTVTATATDDDGNADNCSFDVTVNDNEAPTPSCPADITVNNDPGLCSAVVSFAATATDNCDTDVDITYSQNPGTVFPVGTTTVTATATDDDGNADNCSFDVTVNDNEAPTPSCPADITVNNDPGLCSAVVSFAATATDNCDTDVDITYSQNPGTAFPVGTTTVTATATDDDGNADNCKFDVTVNDNEAPTPSCPADITVNNDPGLCSAVVSFAATATDNCDTDVDITYSQNPGTVFPVGTTTVTATATDDDGNADNCSFDVTVNDNEAPTPSCPADITVNNDPGLCSAVVSFAATATDNCDTDVDITYSQNPGTAFPVGTTTVTATATDDDGNADNCKFDVTVNDNEAPTFSDCPNNINLFNDPGECGAIASWTPPTLEDNCPGATADSSHDPGDFFPVGSTTVTYTGTDAAGNDAADCSFTVSVTDIEEPIIACPADISTGTDPGVCGAQVTFIPAIAIDNCEVEEVKARYRAVDDNNSPIGDWTDRVFDPSGYFPVGRYEVEWRAKDIYGSKRTCFQYLEVYDDEAPVAVCKDLTVDFNGEEEITLTASQVWDEGASSDNCGTVAFVSADLSISCEALGSTVAIPVTIADGAGNEDQCTAYVDVVGLPCGWSEGPNNGSLNCDGQTTSDYDVDDESFALNSDGCRLDSDEGDRATYAYHALCGDGTLTAKLASINTGGYAGLMARESLDPLARRAGVLKNYSTRRVRREWRATYGGIVSQAQSSRSRVKWLRIVRKGNEIKSYTSTNGSYWRLLYKVTFSNLEECIYVGMMAYSLNGSAEVKAVFENVTLSGSGSLAGGLPDDNVDTGLNPNGLQAWGTVGNVGNGTIEVFPNPASNQAQIVLDGFADKPAKLLVRDAFGKLVKQIDLDSALGVVMPLEVQHLPAGMYMISLIQEDRLVISKKLVVQP